MKGPLLILSTTSIIVSLSEAFLHPMMSTRNHSNNRRHKVLSVASNDESGNPTQQQEWDVRRYKDQHSFVWQYGSSLVELLQAKSGERILDVGCGTGELTAAISDSCVNKNNVDVIGMDMDIHMVEEARQQFPHLEFFQGNVCNLVVEEGEDLYDAIFSNAALHWIPPAEVDNSVRAMANALKVGGRFVAEFGGKGNVQQIIEAAIQEEVLTTCPWYFPSISEYTSVLEKHGIEVLSACLFDRPTRLENGDEGLKNWLKMFGGAAFCWEGLTQEEIDSVLNRIQEKLKPTSLYDGHQWTADYRRIRIIGKKVHVEE